MSYAARQPDLLEVAHEMKLAAEAALDHAREMRREADELNEHARLLLRSARDLMDRSTAPQVVEEDEEDHTPETKAGWSFEDVVDTARNARQFTIEQFSRRLGIKPIHTTGWISSLEDAGLLKEDLDEDGLRLYRYIPQNGEVLPELEVEPVVDDQILKFERRRRQQEVAGTGRNNIARDPRVKKMIKEIEAVGGEVRPSGSGHLKIYYGGKVVQGMPKTPSADFEDKLRKELRVAGLPL